MLENSKANTNGELGDIKYKFSQTMVGIEGGYTYSGINGSLRERDFEECDGIIQPVKSQGYECRIGN